VWDAGIVGEWQRWAKLRTQLYPYLAAADREYRRTGLPIMRHLALAYPRDRRATAQEDEFLFGPSLLAAPVLDESRLTRRIYLPRGRWVDLWRSADYRESDGGLSLRKARVLRGGRSVVLPAPLAELPLLARVGTLLPLLPPDVDTLASYGDSSDARSLEESADRRVLLAFPRGRSSAQLEEGGSVRSRERPGEWTLTIDSRRRRTWKIEAALGTLRRPFAVCSVRAQGGKLADWSIDERQHVLAARWSGRRGKLVARAC
jgi:alpha-glucosidase (family GH31 glycosyl hydrolase)